MVESQEKGDGKEAECGKAVKKKQWERQRDGQRRIFIQQTHGLYWSLSHVTVPRVCYGPL